MSKKTITYGELTQKLVPFGYKEVRMNLDGKPTRVYEHSTIEDATMFLPDRDDSEPVHPTLLAKVLLILKTYGLYEEKNPLLT